MKSHAVSLMLVAGLVLACSSKATSQGGTVDGGGGSGGSSSGTGGDSGSAASTGGSATACSAGELACVDSQPHSCTSGGVLEPMTPCTGTTAFCLDGLCVACLPGTRRCEGTTRRRRHSSDRRPVLR